MQSEYGLPDVRVVSGPATAQDYSAWMLQWLNAGGFPTHFYSYNMPKRALLVTQDCFVPALYRAQSLMLVVPNFYTELELEGGCRAHNDIFQEWRIRDRRPFVSVVPLWADIEIHEAYEDEVEETRKQSEQDTRDFFDRAGRDDQDGFQMELGNRVEKLPWE